MGVILQILPASQIDERKWDQCIEENGNGLIYSKTAYLNALSENWHGLVIDDYKTVMPLPWKKKAGFRYCYTPRFMQQLGITGAVDPQILEKIIAAVKKFALYGDFQFNFSNQAIREIIPVSSRTNMVIDLSAPYTETYLAFSQDTKENIRKAAAGNLLYSKEYIPQAIALYRDLYSTKITAIAPKDYDRFHALCEHLATQQQCFTRSVSHNNKLLSTAVLLTDNKRIYNIMNSTTTEGRSKEANYFLFDQLIREFSGSRLLLDLEGSELPGVKKFYEKWGAAAQPYFHFHHNRLPWPLRLLKP